MSPLMRNALEAITEGVNLSTGLAHPSDNSSAKEMFLRLHEAGEDLVAKEIEIWAIMHGWQGRDARELGKLGERVGAGSKVRIQGSPMWADNILDILRASAGSASEGSGAESD